MNKCYINLVKNINEKNNMSRKKKIQKLQVFEGYTKIIDTLNDRMSHDFFVISNYLDEIDTLIIKKTVSNQDKLKRIKMIGDRIRELSIFGVSEFKELDFLEDESIEEE